MTPPRPLTAPRGTRRRDLLGGLALAGLAGTALTGCAGGDGPRRTDSVRIILGHGAAPGNPRSEGALAFQRPASAKDADHLFRSAGISVRLPPPEARRRPDGRFRFERAA